MANSFGHRAYVEALSIALAYELMRMNEDVSSLDQLLLAQRDLSVTEIGLDVGFSETSAFTAVFRKFTGGTPTEYRRSIA